MTIKVYNDEMLQRVLRYCTVNEFLYLKIKKKLYQNFFHHTFKVTAQGVVKINLFFFILCTLLFFFCYQ